MTTRPPLTVQRPAGPGVQTKTITLDSDNYSLSADVTDYVAYVKADNLRSLFRRDEADDITFFQGSTALNHETVRRTRIMHQGASMNGHGTRPVVAGHKLFSIVVGNPDYPGIYAYSIDLTTYEKTEFQLSTTDGDDHAPGGIYIDSSGYLVAFWTFHGADQLLRWRRSSSPYDASAWGAEQTQDLGGGSTYAMVHRISGSKGVVISRAAGIGWVYLATTDGGATWSAQQTLLPATNQYCWFRQRGTSLVFDVLTSNTNADETLYHMVLTFGSDLSSWSWAKADGTPIVDNTPDPTEGDSVFAAGDATGNQKLRINAMDPIGDDLYCIMTVHPSSATTPCEYWRLKYSGTTWTKEQILDTTHNLIEPADVDGMMGCDFDLIDDPDGNTVFAIDGGHPSGNYGYQLKRMTRAADGTWYERKIYEENPFVDGAGNYGMTKLIQPRNVDGTPATAARFMRALWVDGYLDTISIMNAGIACWPGIPDAFYVKIPTLDKDADTSITAEIGYNRRTGRERRDLVWSDYEMVLHGNLWPGSHQLVNSCYLKASDDPGPIEWWMTTSTEGYLNFTDSPLHGSALLEPGTTKESSRSVIADSWVTADTIDWASVAAWTVEYYGLNKLGGALAHGIYDSLEGGTAVASIVLQVTPSGDLNFGVATASGGWDNGDLNGTNAGLISADTWYYGAVLFDGDNISGYVNATLGGTNTAPAGGMDADATVGPHYILNRGASGNIYPWDGYMAEYRIRKSESVDNMKATNANFTDYDNFVAIT